MLLFCFLKEKSSKYNFSINMTEEDICQEFAMKKKRNKCIIHVYNAKVKKYWR